ncbi:hypothetical protein EVJ58_g3868, partial [Rhodofomes roseus]
RLIHCVMVVEGFTTWSELRKWKPELDDIQRVAQEIVNRFTYVGAAKRAQAAGDDWFAHEVYFIRDALIFCRFEHAVSCADAGAVLRVLKYWAFAFRGAGQHNYARECVEILVRWQYEVTDVMRAALEKAWFVNRWGKPGRWIAADLYLEQCNFWVKRVFVASGNGKTVGYIMKKGSACVESFRHISHLFANVFGDPDHHRRSKEVAFQQDLRVLVEAMIADNAHVIAADKHFVPATGSGDVINLGAEVWQIGKFDDYLQSTVYDPQLGYPMVSREAERTANNIASIFDTDTAFDSPVNPLEYNSYVDLLGAEDDTSGGMQGGLLGGGGEFATGMEDD